jgi:CheY-specific phosphatase CheX
MMTTSTQSHLDAGLVNAVMESVTSVFNNMLQSEPKLVNVTATTNFNPSGDVSAIIGIMGQGGEGVMAISLDRKLANKLVARLLGVRESMVLNEDRNDGMGEIANMVCGKLKVYFSEKAEKTYKLSLPTVISGAGHEVSGLPRGIPYILLTVAVESEQFHIQLCFRGQ